MNRTKPDGACSFCNPLSTDVGSQDRCTVNGQYTKDGCTEYRERTDGELITDEQYAEAGRTVYRAQTNKMQRTGGRFTENERTFLNKKIVGHKKQKETFVKFDAVRWSQNNK